MWQLVLLAFFSTYYSTSCPLGMGVYDDLNGNGNQLALDFFSSNYFNDNCPCGFSAGYCNWDQVKITFTGTAKSVVFYGTPDYFVFDNTCFGSSFEKIHFGSEKKNPVQKKEQHPKAKVPSVSGTKY